jgi:predicted RNA-binding Zn ribbon-like protein
VTGNELLNAQVGEAHARFQEQRRVGAPNLQLKIDIVDVGNEGSGTNGIAEHLKPLDDCGNLQSLYSGDGNLSTDFAGVAHTVIAAVPAADRAPGSLELVRRFVNTADLPNGPDTLQVLDQARAWCLSYGLAPPRDEQHVALLRDFRETLRDLLFANNGEGDAPAGWERMRPFLASTRLGLSVNPTHGLELTPEDKGPIASLLAIVYESQLLGTWPRLRACRKASCRFAYYDHTKNASRAWCSMATCGNQAKAQRRRQREQLRRPL